MSKFKSWLIIAQMKRTWIGHQRPIVKPSTHLISSVTSLVNRRMRALEFVYIVEKVAHAHARAQKASLEWFLSTPKRGVVPRLLSETCWLHIHRSTFMITITWHKTCD